MNIYELLYFICLAFAGLLAIIIFIKEWKKKRRRVAHPRKIDLKEFDYFFKGSG